MKALILSIGFSFVFSTGAFAVDERYASLKKLDQWSSDTAQLMTEYAGTYKSKNRSLKIEYVDFEKIGRGEELKGYGLNFILDGNPIEFKHEIFQGKLQYMSYDWKKVELEDDALILVGLAVRRLTPRYKGDTDAEPMILELVFWKNEKGQLRTNIVERTHIMISPEINRSGSIVEKHEIQFVAKPKGRYLESKALKKQ